MAIQIKMRSRSGCIASRFLPFTMYLMRTNHPAHPQTLAPGRITQPFQVGLRNSVVALAAIGLGGIGYLVRYSEQSGFTAWWAWGAIAAGAVALCFGHAYLGARIGGRRANSIAVFFLLGCLVILILWLQHAIDGGR